MSHETSIDTHKRTRSHSREVVLFDETYKSLLISDAKFDSTLICKLRHFTLEHEKTTLLYLKTREEHIIINLTHYLKHDD